MKEETKSKLFLLLLVFMFFGAIAIPTTGWVVSSHFEAKSYNRLTGAHATTWDAMWVELRVQDTPK